MCAGQPEGPAAIPGPQRQRGDGLHSQCAKIAQSDRLLPASRSAALLFRPCSATFSLQTSLRLSVVKGLTLLELFSVLRSPGKLWSAPSITLAMFSHISRVYMRTFSRSKSLFQPLSSHCQSFLSSVKKSQLQVLSSAFRLYQQQELSVNLSHSHQFSYAFSLSQPFLATSSHFWALLSSQYFFFLKGS